MRRALMGKAGMLAAAHAAAACGGDTGDDSELHCGADGVCVAECAAQGQSDPDCADAAGSLDADGEARPPQKGGATFVADGCSLVSALTIPASGQPTSEVLLGPRVTDGEVEVEVDCTVAAAGDGYEVLASAQEGTRSFTVAAALAPSAIEGERYQGPGTVYVFDSTSSTNLVSENDGCTITVLANQDIAPGRIWGNFSCEAVSQPRLTTPTCSAEGSFVFENCEREPS